MARDLLDILLTGSITELSRERERIGETLGHGDLTLVGRVEQQVSREPESIQFDSRGNAVISALGRTYSGGRFATPQLAELNLGNRANGTDNREDAEIRLSVVEGAGLLTDIGALQAWAAEDTAFQLASQFNCLESPGPYLVKVSEYLTDSTQGPRGAVSAFPAALVRHYAAPEGRGGRFTQNEDREIDLLADALPSAAGRVEHGYLTIQNIDDKDLAAEALAANFGKIRIGVHSNAEVVLGANWGGAVSNSPRITQLCTSTLAAGLYAAVPAHESKAVGEICRQLLRASYLGTLLAAYESGAQRVVLTLIGGGVFGNPHPLIIDCILWATRRLRSIATAGARGLHIILNARGLDHSVDRLQLREACRDLDGDYRAIPA